MNCPRCGNPYNSGDRFCGRCGQSLADADLDANAGANDADRLNPPMANLGTPADAVTPADAGQSVPGAEPEPGPSPHPYYPSPGTAQSPRPNWPPAFALGNPGGFGWRVLAYLVDLIIVSLPLAIAWAIMGLPTPTSMDEILNPPEGYERLQLLNALLSLIYDTALISLFATTLGKRAFRLYVIRSDGSRVGPLRALARHLLTALSAAFTLGFIFLVVAFREDKRGLHDLICDTVVIRRPRQPD